MEGYIFDYRLGYIRERREPGFDAFGGGARRVVALGGYTTPDMAQRGDTWTGALAALYGEGIELLSGCTDGYSSAQMLTLFIRDAILMKPETVVCLSGFHNIAYKLGLIQNKADAPLLASHPFVTPGQLHFLREITSGFGLGKDEVFYGEENNAPAWEFWLLQMAQLECICKEFGIEFKSYLQPCVFSGGYARNERENAFLRGHYRLSDAEIEAFHAGFQREYAMIAQGAKGLDYITDLSYIFDGYEDAYVDAYHVKDGLLQKLAEGML